MTTASVGAAPSSAKQLTAGDKGRVKRPKPVKLIALLLTLLLVAGAGGGYWWWRSQQVQVVEVVEAQPVPLSAVQRAGVTELLRQFTSSAHAANGTIESGQLKAKVAATVTADGKFGFGTLNAAGIDAATLLAEGVTYVKGTSTFWSAISVQGGNFPGWVKMDPKFFDNRIFLPAAAVSAALAPTENSRILDDRYFAGEHSAGFGPNGLESVHLTGYDVTVLPSDDAGVYGTARPMFDAIGAPGELVWVAGAWSVAAPPAPAGDGDGPR